MKEGKITCAKCGSEVVLMAGDYVMGIGWDCPSCNPSGTRVAWLHE